MNIPIVRTKMSVFQLIAHGGWEDAMFGPIPLFSIKHTNAIYTSLKWEIERSRLISAIVAETQIPKDPSAIIADYAGTRHLHALKQIGHKYYDCCKCHGYSESCAHVILSDLKERLKNSSGMSEKTRNRLIRKFVSIIAKLSNYPEPPHPMMLPDETSMMPQLIELLETMDYAFDKINNDIEVSDEDDDSSILLTEQGIELVRDTFYCMVQLVWP